MSNFSKEVVIFGFPNLLFIPDEKAEEKNHFGLRLRRFFMLP